MTQITTQNRKLSPMEIAGKVANDVAASNVLTDYRGALETNTLKTHDRALCLFAEYIDQSGVGYISCEELATNPECWRGVSWGMIKYFIDWLLDQGHSIASVNNRLSIIKTYCKKATKAGAIDSSELVKIRAVSAIGRKKGANLDKKRSTTRIGAKKGTTTPLTAGMVETIRGNLAGDSDQEKRDRLMLAILSEHGLRVSELALLEKDHINLDAGIMTFYRPKSSKWGTHEIQPATRAALVEYLAIAPAGKYLLSKTTRLLIDGTGGRFRNLPMTTRGIQRAVARWGRWIDCDLSPHDFRHFAAGEMATNHNPFELCNWFGWESLATAQRYVERPLIAKRRD